MKSKYLKNVSSIKSGGSNRTLIYRRTLATIITITIASIGTYLIYSSHAQGPYTSEAASKGVLSSTGAKLNNDTTADGSESVMFGSSSSGGGGTTTDLLGLWNNGTITASSLGVTQQVYGDYAYGTNDTEYSVPSGAQGLQDMVAVGDLTAAQATVIATNLLESGQSNAFIRPMWEQNQGSWFSAWNESTLSAAQYISAWKTIYTAMKGVQVSGVTNNLKFIWNPNAGEGNNLSGRTTQDTWPGEAYVNYVGLDIYDNAGGLTSEEADVNQILDFASCHPQSGWPELQNTTTVNNGGTCTPLPVAFPEWGLAGSDDTAYMTYMTGIMNNSSDNVGLQSYFSCTAAECGFSSDLTQFPNSENIYKTAFKNE